MLNTMDLRDGTTGSGGGERGTPRGSGSRIRNGNLSSRDNGAVADVIACATGYSMESLGRKFSNNQFLNPAAVLRQDQLFHQRMNQSSSNSSSGGSGGSGSGGRFQPLSLMHSNPVRECLQDEESMSTQTPLYEAIDPSRLTR